MGDLVQRADGWELAWGTPTAALRPGIVRYNGFDLDLPQVRTRVELPSLTTALVINFGGAITVAAPSGQSDTIRPFTSVLCGPRSSPLTGRHGGRVSGIDVVMAPWAARAMFGVPMHHLANRTLDVTEVAGPRSAGLSERLAEAEDWPTRFAVLDAVLTRLWERGREAVTAARHAYDQLRRAGGATSIADLATDTGCNVRSLQRAFATEIGMSPKAAARILRLQRAMRLLAASRPLALISHECGYFDQPHFTRDITMLTGRTPLALAAELSATPERPPNTARVAGQVTSIVHRV